MSNKIPYHIVLFPDGNRHWAQKRGLPIFKGYEKGQKKFKEFLHWCKKRGVKVVTVFGFSTENWKRPKQQVDYLIKLFGKTLSDKENVNQFQKEGIKVKIIGQKEKLPKSLQKIIVDIESLTKNNKKLLLNLAVSYGGRWDILQAVQKILKKKPPVKKITENLIESYLSTSDLPAPDFIIRAGGEKRLSNFLLWQAAYSEIYFSKKLWPEFTENDLEKAFKEYARRQRRFGR
ncbi:polyprenyl diphosphate synthase [Patescibacteria group bacterium]